MASSECDVAVVGAGLAGLVAARDLIAAGREVVVLEARERVGGRLLNQDIGDGKIVEAGGQWIGPTQDHVAALARDLGLTTHRTHGEGENVIEFGGKVSRYRGTIPRLGAPILADFAQAQRRLDRLARLVPLDRPWTQSRWDRGTLADWLAGNTMLPATRRLFRALTEAVWATEPEDVSMLHFLFYVHSGGGIDMLLDSEGGAQQDRIVGGTQLIAIRLAETLGDAVKLGRPVRRIAWEADSVTLHCGRRRAGGGDALTVKARRAIVALPPTMHLRIVWEPGLPARRDQLLQRMPAGAVIKCHAIYDEPFWRADGLSGQGGSDVGPAKVVFDNSPPDGSPGVLLAFLEGRAARDLGAWREVDRRAAVLSVLARLFGPNALKPSAFYEQDWAAEEFTRGCYGAFLPPGTWTQLGDVLRPPIGPLHWAGAEHATVWSGYMDGAVRSGKAAAAEALLEGQAPE